MRVWALVVFAFVGMLALTLSLLHGQASPPTPLPAVPAATVPLSPAPPAALTKPPKDFGPLTPSLRHALTSAQRGADWLFRMHNEKGRFVAGYRPSLKQAVEGDFYLRQAAAAASLARAARFLGEDRYAARATQAVLSLLEDTAEDRADSCRRVTLPGDDAHRLRCGGALLVAIGELPTPQKDVLDQADQLCRWVHKQPTPPAVVLLGVLLSHKHRPADWKLAFVKKALPACRASFEAAPTPEEASALAAACAEAHALTKDRALADCAFQVAEWACKLHYGEIDPRRWAWYGGFRGWQNGRPVESMPTAEGAGLARAVIEACRVAQLTGDATRHQRYRETAERALQFLGTLQYTEAGTQHFAPWYRARIVGGVHASPADGDLRIDHTADAVAAFAAYAEHTKR